MSRASRLKSKLIGNEGPDDIMMMIMERFTKTELIPEVGKYYTFVYSPKTPDVQYDQYPLIACVSVERWGFKGINFHWGSQRNYTWEEVVGSLHEIYADEISIMRSIPYTQLNINN